MELKMKKINFSEQFKKLYKQFGVIIIVCLLLFQPANNSNSQVRSGRNKIIPRDNTKDIAKTNDVLDSALSDLKDLDKALKPKVIYKTRWRTPKTDTVYIAIPDSLNVPDYLDYKIDPEIKIIHDTIKVEVIKKSWLYRLTHKNK
jgi:hypothetical protein